MNAARHKTGRGRFVWVGAVCAAAVCAWAVARGQDAPTTPTTAPTGGPDMRSVSPHWKPDRCDACHATDNGKLRDIAPEAVETICLRCHNGREASAEPHPSGRPARTEHAQTPEDWPTPGGRLSCLTCHEVLNACDRNRTRPAFNPSFMRGPIASGTTEYCAICHEADAAHQKLNPHRMLRADGSVDRATCQRCHTADIRYDRNAQRSGNPLLIRSEMEICLGCHVEHVDFFSPGHIGARTSPAMRAYMAARETPLPLSPEGVITCATCHNPHQAGLFPESSRLGRGGIELGPDADRLALRGEGASICGECHGQ